MSVNDYSEAHLDSTFISLEMQFDQDFQDREIEDEQLRLKWLGRKQGLLTKVFDEWLAITPPEAKGRLGKRFNHLKQVVEGKIQGRKDDINYLKGKTTALHPTLDLTLPGHAPRPGAPHPLIQTMHGIVDVFERLGYSVATGPEVETDFLNFEALNFPPNHPARDTQDTLLLANQHTKPEPERLLLRTHTSPVQIRSMLANDPPLRLVIPGKVHRNEAADATHSPVFHQVEGLCVGPDITFSDLKGTLAHAMKALFGASVKTRFFPSFFPFTEPSADVQISCPFCNGAGCRKCKHSGWIELLGCGMVDPNVFRAVDRRRAELGLASAYNPDRISGFAFGMGVDRIAMMQHNIADIGLLYSGDQRFLQQFA